MENKLNTLQDNMKIKGDLYLKREELNNSIPKNLEVEGDVIIVFDRTYSSELNIPGNIRFGGRLILDDRKANFDEYYDQDSDLD